MARVNRLWYPRGTQIPDFDHTLSALQRAHGYGTGKNFRSMSEQRQQHIAHHFLISKTGFPPDNYIDLTGPVVSGSHKLSKRKLDNLDARMNQIKGISESTREKAQMKVDRLQREEFDVYEYGPRK